VAREGITRKKQRGREGVRKKRGGRERERKRESMKERLRERLSTERGEDGDTESETKKERSPRSQYGHPTLKHTQS
jgi:hypothetical protein